MSFAYFTQRLQMSFKSHEQKKQYQREWIRSKRVGKRCKQCSEILPYHHSKFCNEGCTDKYHKEQAKLKRQKEKDNQMPRFCKYIHCRKLLPKEAHATKKYCQGTDCAYKMNQLEAKKHRDANKKEHKPVYRVCKLEGCDKTFEVEKGKSLARYCSDECRAEKNRRAWRENAIKEKDKLKTIIEEKKVRGNGKPKEFSLPKRFLVRGLISNGNRADSISVNA